MKFFIWLINSGVLTSLLFPHLSSSLTDSLLSLNLLCHSKIDARFMQHAPKAVWSIPYISVAFFPSLKQNFIAYHSSKVSSRPDCIFEIHQLWQSGFSWVYSNSCCSCWFEPEIIKISQSSHKMYSNNIVNFQESMTILNACTKKSQETPVYVYIYIVIHRQICFVLSKLISVARHIYIYIYKVKFVTIIKGNLKAPFSIATTPKCKGGYCSFLWIVPYTLDLYLIMLNVKQGNIKYHFFWVFCMTWPVIESRSSGSLANTIPIWPLM